MCETKIRVECDERHMIFNPFEIFIYQDKMIFSCDWFNCPEKDDCNGHNGKIIDLKKLEEIKAVNRGRRIEESQIVELGLEGKGDEE